MVAWLRVGATPPPIPMSSVRLSVPEIARFYPLPRATNQAVLNNPHTFYETLQILHGELQLRFTSNRHIMVAGQDIQLHLLYTSVFNAGGFEQVDAVNGWAAIVTQLFGINPVLRSISTRLRNVYARFLFDYEQVYLWRNRGEIHSAVRRTTIYDFVPAIPHSQPVGTAIVGATITSSTVHGYEMQMSVGGREYDAGVVLFRSRAQRGRGGHAGSGRWPRSGSGRWPRWERESKRWPRRPWLILKMPL